MKPFQPDPAVLADVAAFARVQLASRDIDPAYPVLASLELNLERSAAVWRTVLYCAYYDLASSEEAFLAVPEPGPIPDSVARLPTGIERRGLRGGANLQRHIASVLALADHFGSIWQWLGYGVEPDREGNVEAWRRVQNNASLAWGNGRWATYKLAELLKSVHKWPLAAPDMGNEGSSGPVAGLRLLFPSGELDEVNTATLDLAAFEVRHRLAADYHLDLPWEQLETVLCDFHALADGRYYPGFDIDLMLAQANRPGVPFAVVQRILAARSGAFDPRWLAERHGGSGVDPGRKRLYRDRGVIFAEGWQSG